MAYHHPVHNTYTIHYKREDGKFGPDVLTYRQVALTKDAAVRAYLKGFIDRGVIKTPQDVIIVGVGESPNDDAGVVADVRMYSEKALTGVMDKDMALKAIFDISRRSQDNDWWYEKPGTTSYHVTWSDDGKPIFTEKHNPPLQ